MDRTINVSTNMSTQVPPDTINVDITIQGTSKTREECTAKYNELLQTMKDSLEQNGLSSSILKNNRYSISAHENKQYQKEKWERYYVAHTIVEGFDFRAELSIKEQLETNLVEKIWKALSSCGDEVTFSVEFAIENEKPIKNKLSTDAIISCRQQANLLAKAAGAKVVGLQNATYDIKEKDFVYTACACSAYDDYESKNQVPAFDPSDIDVNCYVKLHGKSSYYHQMICCSPDNPPHFKGFLARRETLLVHTVYQQHAVCDRKPFTHAGHLLVAERFHRIEL